MEARKQRSSIGDRTGPEVKTAKSIHRKKDITLGVELRNWLYSEGQSFFYGNGYDWYEKTSDKSGETMKELLDYYPLSKLEEHKGKIEPDWSMKFVEKWWDTVLDSLSEQVRCNVVFMGDDGNYYSYEIFMDPNRPETGNLYEERENLSPEVRENI